MWRTPGTIYLNTQLIDKDVYVYSGSEMFVEPLDRPEPMKRSTQMQVYVRWWRPSTYTVEPTREIVLDTAKPAELKQKVSDSKTRAERKERSEEPLVHLFSACVV